MINSQPPHGSTVLYGKTMHRSSKSALAAAALAEQGAGSKLVSHLNAPVSEQMDRMIDAYYPERDHRLGTKSKRAISIRKFSWEKE
jgi:hypothetical protein